MKRHAALGTGFAAIGCLVIGACFYDVPDVTPEIADGGVVNIPDGALDALDARVVPFDSSLPDTAAPCVRCKQTVLVAEPGTLVAFTLDVPRNTALLSVETAGTGSALRSFTLPASPAMTTTTLLTSTAASIETIAPVSAIGRIFFLAGAQLLSTSSPSGGTATALTLADAGTFVPDYLASNVEGQTLFVGGSGSPVELRAVSTTGASVVLTTTPTVYSFGYASQSLYWYSLQSPGNYQLQRFDVSTQQQTPGGTGYVDAMAFANGTPVVASSTQITAIGPGTVTPTATVVSQLSAPPRVLAAMNPGAGTSTIVAFWTDSATGVVRRGSATTPVAAAPPVSTPTGILDIKFLGVRGNDLYAAGNAGGVAYVVQLAD